METKDTYRGYRMRLRDIEGKLKHETILARVYFALSILFLILWLTK